LPETIGYADAAVAGAVSGPAPLHDCWYAVWTHSHCEQLVHDQLAGKGLTVLLPKLDVWSRRRGVRRVVRKPMFPGYLFVRDVRDRGTHVEILKARGVVRVLGDGWERLAPIPAEEVQAIERLSATRQPALPYPYLTRGRRVRVVAGPLAGLEGILDESRVQQGVLVVSIHLLQRSVAVVVDGLDVVPA
jgi:transcription termination/antitermination protein NusG